MRIEADVAVVGAGMAGVSVAHELAADRSGLWWLAGQGDYGIQLAPALAGLVAGAMRGTAVVPAALAAGRTPQP